MATRRRRTTSPSSATPKADTETQPTKLEEMLEVAAQREQEAARQAAIVPLPDLPVALPSQKKSINLPVKQDFQRRIQSRRASRG